MLRPVRVRRCRGHRSGLRGLILRHPHDFPVRRGSRLCPVRGLAVQRRDGHASADQGDRGGDQGPALRLLPAFPLATPCGPTRRRGGGGVRAVVRVLLRRWAEFLGAGSRVVPQVGRQLPRRRGRCGRSVGEGSDVRGVGTAAGAHEGAVEMPTACGAVVHLRSSCVHFCTGEAGAASKGSEAFEWVCAVCVTLLRRCVRGLTAVGHIPARFPLVARYLICFAPPAGSLGCRATHPAAGG